MRCSICGKQIPNGTLCEECYNDAMEDRMDRVVSNHIDEKTTVQNDKKILMKVGRKFLPKYQLLTDWELVLFCIFLFSYATLLQRISFILTAILLDFLLLAIFLFIRKRIAIGTKCFFYETKIVYQFDFLFIHKKLVYQYSDIQDIVYRQRFLQKKFNLGDITVIAKKKGILFKGFVISDVANISDVFGKLTNLVGTKLV